jgi:Bacterial dnaA protein helix-turn-helix
MAAWWSVEETDRLIELWKAGEKVGVIALQIGRTERGTAHKIRVLHQLGAIKRRNVHSRFTPEIDAEIIVGSRDGKGWSAIAASLGLTYRKVFNRAFRLGLVGTGSPKGKTPVRVCSFSEVRSVVLDRYKTSMSDIASPARDRKSVEPRQVLMAVGYRYSGLSLTQIGERCRRDHTSVLHAVRIAPTKYPEALAEVEARLFQREAAE